MDWGQVWSDASGEAVAFATRWGWRVLGAILLAIAGWVASRWLSGRVVRFAERTGKVDRTVVSVLAKVVRISVLVVVTIAVLENLGVDTTSFLAFLGAAGLAVGLALRDTAADVAGGIVLFVLRPFSLGDSVMIGTTAGTVEEIGIFQTTLINGEGVPVCIPNSKVRTSEVQNFTRARKRRIDLTVGISYDADVERARAALLETVRQDTRVLSEPPPFVEVGSLTESSVQLVVQAWAKPDGWFGAKVALARAIKQRLDSEGIEVAVPRRIVRTVGAA
jgi:small conductance mechanosensitive channel